MPIPNWPALALIALLAIVQRHLVMANADVAWLLVVAEKWLDGARPYVDILEVNPPFSIWLHALFVVPARWSGVRPETVIDILAVCLAAACLWLASCNLRPAIVPRDRILAPFVFAAMLLLPASCYGEREHFALILFAPCLALAIRRAHEVGARLDTTPIWQIIASGVCAGLVVCIKPHFALAIAAVSLAAGALRRSWRPVFAPENFIAAAMLGAYFVAAWRLFPAYWTEMLPILQLLYLPARNPFWLMIAGEMPAFAGLLAIIALVLWRRCGAAFFDARRTIACAAMTGFLVAVFVQGKGWPYHFLPAVSLLLIVLVDVWLDPAIHARQASLPRWTVAAVTAVLALLSWRAFDEGIDMRVIEAPLRRISPHPRVTGVVSDFSMTFPAVRSVDGVWVGSVISQWAGYHAKRLAERAGADTSLLARYRAAEDSDRQRAARDIRDGKPDVVVIERAPVDMLAWARADASFARLLDCFSNAGRYGYGAEPTPEGPKDFFVVELMTPQACAAPASDRN